MDPDPTLDYAAQQKEKDSADVDTPLQVFWLTLILIVVFLMVVGIVLWIVGAPVYS